MVRVLFLGNVNASSITNFASSWKRNRCRFVCPRQACWVVPWIGKFTAFTQEEGNCIVSQSVAGLFGLEPVVKRKRQLHWFSVVCSQHHPLSFVSSEGRGKKKLPRLKTSRCHRRLVQYPGQDPRVKRAATYHDISWIVNHHLRKGHLVLGAPNKPRSLALSSFWFMRFVFCRRWKGVPLFCKDARIKRKKGIDDPWPALSSSLYCQNCGNVGFF